RRRDPSKVEAPEPGVRRDAAEHFSRTQAHQEVSEVIEVVAAQIEGANWPTAALRRELRGARQEAPWDHVAEPRNGEVVARVDCAPETLGPHLLGAVVEPARHEEQLVPKRSDGPVFRSD